MMNATISYRSWFSFTKNFTIVMSVCDIIFGLIFVSIILNNQTYRSVSNLLVVNTVFSIMFLILTILIIIINMS